MIYEIGVIKMYDVRWDNATSHLRENTLRKAFFEFQNERIMPGTFVLSS